MRNRTLLLTVLAVLFQSQSLSADKYIAISDIINSDVIIGNNNSITKELSPPDGDVEVEIGIAKFTEKEKNLYLGELSHQVDLEYKEYKSNKEDEITIRPSIDKNDYINNYLSGKTVTTSGVYYQGLGLSTSVPFIEAKVVNNSAESITVDEITLDVEKSSSYKKPFVFFSEPLSDFAKISVLDEGNITSKSIDFRFNIYSSEEKGNGKPYRYTINDNFSDGYAELDFYKTLESEGVDAKFLLSSFGNLDSRNSKKTEAIYPIEKPEIFKKPLGKFTNTEICWKSKKPDTLESYINKNSVCSSLSILAYVVGEFTVKGIYRGEEVIKKGMLKATIKLTAPDGLGAGFPTIRIADIVLKDDGENYPITINMSRYLKPYEVEKYILSVDSYKPGLHKFTVKIKTSNNKIYLSKKISLFIFKPRIDGYEIKGKHKLYQVKAKPSLRVRSSPNISDHNIIGKFKNGEIIEVYRKVGGKTVLNGKSGYWVMTKLYANTTYKKGYVFDSFLIESKN